MNEPLAPWQQRVWDSIAGALAAGRLGHALLFCGPPRLGKRVLAERLAQALLCESRDADQQACGRCRQCAAFLRRYQTDPPQTRPDGSLAHPDGHPEHPDVRFVGYIVNAKGDRMRSEIAVEQVRELGAWFALTPRQARAQVALIEPADGLNAAAANALLKTLEEPLPGRFLLLASARPARLPATIRSRCQRIELRLPPAAEARGWLLAQGLDDQRVDAALAAAEGNPGVALAFAGDNSLTLMKQVRSDLAALAGGRERAIAVAVRWADGASAQRLRFAAEFARDLGRARFGGAADPQIDGAGLTAPIDFPKLAAWFDEANRTRELLDAPLRTDLLLTGLLLRWQEALRN